MSEKQMLFLSTLAALCIVCTLFVYPGETSPGHARVANDRHQIDVKDHGAVGDGKTDDTAAIQAVINAAGAVRVFLPPGEYYTTSALELPDFASIAGAGKHSTILKCDSDGVRKNSDDANGRFLSIKDMKIINTDTKGSNSEKGIDFTGVDYSLVDNVRIENFHTGILFSRGTAAAPCWFNRVTETDLILTKVGIDINNSVGYESNSNVFDNIHIEADGSPWQDRTGIEVSGYGHQFSNMYLGMPNGRAAVYFPSPVAGNNLFRGLYIESRPTYGVLAESGFGGRGGNTIIGIHFDGAPGKEIVDPHNELTVLTSSGFRSWKNTLTVNTAKRSVGIGTAAPQGALDVVSTTGALIVPRMNSAQRDALTAVSGMMIYNTSSKKFNFYENGAWVAK